MSLLGRRLAKKLKKNQKPAQILATTQGTGETFIKTAPRVTANNLFTTNRKGLLGGFYARKTR